MSAPHALSRSSTAPSGYDGRVSGNAADEIAAPGLPEAMLVLAEALRDHQTGGSSSTSYLEMAKMADGIGVQLHELARRLVAVAREEEGATWADVGDAFGVTRQAAMRRWSLAP